MSSLYINHMPTEIILKIFSYLEVVDMISVSESCDLFKNATDLLIMRHLNLCGNYNFLPSHLEATFFKAPRSALITFFNINSVYWIPGKFLRTCLNRMSNLEHLYVLDTTLSVSEKDLLTFQKLLKLKTLAFTLRETVPHFRIFMRLKFLCIHVEMQSPKNLLFVKGLVHEDMVEYRVILMNNTIGHRIIPFIINESYRDKYVLIDCKRDVTHRLNLKKHSDCKRARLELPIENEPHWNLMENITIDCGSRKVLIDMTFTKVTRCVKKISICHCLFYDYKAIINNIIDKCPEVIEVELWGCIRHSNESVYTNDSLNKLVHFKKMKRLTLDKIPIYITGSFLVQVLQSCKYLQYLSICMDKHNPNMFGHLLMGLKTSDSLLDLRIEGVYFPINRFFLMHDKTKLLQRLYIKCKIFDILNVGSFMKFMNANEQLIFMQLVIRDLPKTVAKQCQRFIKNRSHLKIYNIGLEDSQPLKKFTIPFIHQHEIVDHKTHIDVYDVFAKFY